MSQTVKEYCAEVYADTYLSEKARIEAKMIENSRSGRFSEGNLKEIETSAQKEAIKTTIIGG